MAQGLILVGDAGGVQPLLRGTYVIFGRFQHGVESADYRHGQDDVPVLAPDVDIAQHVVRNAPYETADVEGGHRLLLLL